MTTAHTALLALAARARPVLASYEGTGATLSYGDLAAQIGIDLRSLGQTDAWLTFMALDAAVEARGWQDVQNEGEPKRFRKAVTVTEFKRQNERNRRKARA